VQIDDAQTKENSGSGLGLAIIAGTTDLQYHDNAVVNSHGMDGFIAKPITAGDINGLIEQYCRAA